MKKNKLNKSFLSFATLCLISLFFSANLSSAEVDTLAPDFTVEGHDGKTYKLSELRGQRVILEWYNRDCPFVRKFYDVGKMQELQKKYKENAVWLTVVSSNVGKQGYMTAEQTKVNVQEEDKASRVVLLDTDGTIGRAYDAKTTPQIVIIDEEGVLRYNGAIDSIRSANSDDIAKARNYLELAMADLKAGRDVQIKRTPPYGCSIKY